MHVVPERENRTISSLQRGRRHHTEASEFAPLLRLTSRDSLLAVVIHVRILDFGLVGARPTTNVAYVVVDMIGMQMRIITEKNIQRAFRNKNENVLPVRLS